MRVSRTARRGFTLIALLIVVVIIGVLASIAIPKFRETKSRAYLATLKSDLKNLASKQESYFYGHESYGSSLSQLNSSVSEGVIISIVEADARGWSATATHPAAAPLTCAVFYGQAAPLAPAVAQGLISCE
jgi:type IV pilus assembly protein PilA